MRIEHGDDDWGWPHDETETSMNMSPSTGALDPEQATGRVVPGLGGMVGAFPFLGGNSISDDFEIDSSKI